MKPLTVLLVSCYLFSCKPATNTETLPAAPSSVDAVKKTLTGKSYTTTNVGLLSPFASDTTVEWMSSMKDTTKFFTDYQKERMAFTLKFINDTTFESMDEGKAAKGTYTIDNKNQPGIMSDDEPENDGIKLRLTTADSSYGNMTYTMYVKGMDDSKLMLALPREMNRRKVVALMKSN